MHRWYRVTIIKHKTGSPLPAVKPINNKKERKSDEDNKTNIKKLKLSTNLLHDRFHRSDGAMATIKAHDF